MRRAISWAGTVVAGTALLLTASAAASGVYPDDRPGIRGAGADATLVVVRPDDRAGIRGPGQLGPVEGVRPDDRPGVRGPGSAPVAPVTAPVAPVTGGGGIDWYDVGLGVLIGAAAILAAFAIGYPLRHRVHRPHWPHRAVHGH